MHLSKEGILPQGPPPGRKALLERTDPASESEHLRPGEQKPRIRKTPRSLSEPDRAYSASRATWSSQIEPSGRCR